MKILITGGRGFIGRRLHRALEKNPANEVSLLVLDKDKDEGDERLRNVIIGDICNRNLELSGFDVIYHLAAVSNPRVCEQDKDLAWRVNVDGTRNLLEKMGPKARMVFMSSAHVYQNGDVLHKEDELPDPQTFYGLTKLAGEALLNYYSRAKGMNGTIFRLFNAYAADQPEGLIVPDVIKKYRTQKEVEMIDPESEIDLVHVDDVVEILASAPGMDGTFNICSGKPMRIREVYAAIKRYTGAGDAHEKVARNNVKRLLGSNARIREFGFTFREFSLP